MRYGHCCLCIVTLIIMICGVSAAAAMQACCGQGYGHGYGGYAWDTRSPYSLPACFAPGYSSWSLGCCPFPRPTCCDHIWDGYCTEEGCHCGCGPCATTYGGPCYGPAVVGTGCMPGGAAYGPTGFVGYGQAQQTVIETPLEVAPKTTAPEPAAKIQYPKPQKATGEK